MQGASLRVVEGHEVVSATLVCHVETPPLPALDLPTTNNVRSTIRQSLMPSACASPHSRLQPPYHTPRTRPSPQTGLSMEGKTDAGAEFWGRWGQTLATGTRADAAMSTCRVSLLRMRELWAWRAGVAGSDATLRRKRV